jgi:hypothetical protein
MKSERVIAVLAAAVFLFLALAAACSTGSENGSNSRGSVDDDTVDDDVSPSDDDDDDDNDSVDDDDADDDTTGTQTYSGVVVSAGDGLPLGGAVVTLLDDATGQPLDPPAAATADENGAFSIEVSLSITVVGVKAEQPSFYDTYSYHDSVSDLGDQREIRVYPVALVEAFAAAAGVTVNDDKGQIVGIVLWANPAGPREAVGCAEVSLQPASGHVFYFDNTGLPSPGRDSTDPASGSFAGFNVNLNSLTVESDADGETVSYAVPALFADSVTAVVLLYPYPDYPANPTPGGCQ